MKMNRFVMLCAGVCMMAPALSKANTEEATEDTSEIAMTLVEDVLGNPHKAPKECETLQLEEAQKTSLKQAKYAYVKERNTLGAAIKNAWMDYSHTLVDPASTKDQGLAAAAGVKNAMSAAGMAKANFEMKVYYDILKPEQRAPALKCTMKIMKQKMMDRLKKQCAKMPPEKKP